ncbi:tRNA (uracil-5-)-methyltransferase homolog A isoform X1 [Octopus bimaculoides]|nr:tRNA (uracil-5-)-methyltransferase homolog A isoform X1 [Octopus bimaculoides]|eukprot:XP_014773283.1 PREDICTED: tRNA (uracil-5-)-methyltransferase homolog A-like isoform X1 [Octopus bimaculoides]
MCMCLCSHYHRRHHHLTRQRGVSAVNGSVFCCSRLLQDDINTSMMEAETNRNNNSNISDQSFENLSAKRKDVAGSSQDVSESKKSKISIDIPDDITTAGEKVKRALLPFCDVPYEDQLRRKASDVRDAMVKFSWEVHRTCPKWRNWLKEQMKNHSGVLCEIEKIRPSPVLNAYRNKSEFTIASSSNGTNERIVGFRVGSYRDGSSVVGEPYACDNLPDSMKLIAKVFQQYVRQSQYDVYNDQTHDGHWRQLIVRTSSQNDIMIIPVFYAQFLSDDEVDAEKAAMTEYFSDGDGVQCGVTSLYFRCLSNRLGSCRQHAVNEHLWGKKCITEVLLELSFHIYPDTFFSFNNPAAALLYTMVGDLCLEEPNNIVFNICCSTGTVALSLAKRVKSVVAVDMWAANIEEAKKNAELNNVTNVIFHHAKAEEVTNQLDRWLKGQSAVAVLDSPCAEMQSKVIYALRRCHFIHRVIYISCNPVAAIQNFTDLMRPKSQTMKGKAFYPVKAIPVDLSPHTKLCVMVVMFKRRRFHTDMMC